MKKLILILALFFSASVLLISCKESKKEVDVDQTELGVEKADLAMNDAYQCPMDCEKGKTYDKEGTCPVCNMALKKGDKDESDSDHEGHDHDDNPDETKEGE